MGGCTLLLTLTLLELQLLIHGQLSTAVLLSNDSNVHNELAEQLIDIHREIIKMQMSLNDSQRNPVSPPGGLQSLTQQVNRMLIYALPGVLGRTVGMVQDGNFAFLGADDNSDGESDYQLSENVKQSVKEASRTVRSMPSSFFKSLETLQVISSNLMPATKYNGAASAYRGLRAINHLTQGTVRLSIYSEDTDRNRHNWMYSSFAVGDVSGNYRLHIGGYTVGPSECMYYNNGSQFSTWDQDRDGWSDNCAMRSSGGWWFNSCANFNPNGRYEDGPEGIDKQMVAYIGQWTRMAVVAMRINV